MSSEDEEDDRFQLDPEGGYHSRGQMHYGARAYGQGNQINGGFHVRGDFICNVCHFFSCSLGSLCVSLRDAWHRFHTWLAKRAVRNPLIAAALALIATIVGTANDSTYAPDIQDIHDHDRDHARASNTSVVTWHAAARAPSATCTPHGTTACTNGRRAASSNACVTGCMAGCTCYPADSGACAAGLTCGSFVGEEGPTVVSRCGVPETAKTTAVAITAAATTVSTTTNHGGG